MRYILIPCFLFLLTLVSAQKTSLLEVTESTVYKDKVLNYDILSIHTSSEGKTGIVREGKRNFLFDIFDDNLNKTYSKVEQMTKKEKYIGEVFSGNEMKFFTVSSPSKKERIVSCYILNMESKSLKKIKLFETTVEKKQNLFQGKNKRQTGFAISQNGKYFAIATDNIKKNVNSYTIRVYHSSDLKMVYKKSYQEHKLRYFEHNDMSVENDATVYIVGKQFLNGKNQKKMGGDVNYHFTLNKISEKESQDITIKLDDEHIKSLRISDAGETLQLIGFYSERNVNRIKGYCNFMVDKVSFSVNNRKLSNLPLSVFEDLYGAKRSERKSDKELANFYIDYILDDDEGNTYLLAEEFYITQNYVSTGPSTGYFETTYHYDDILILKYGATGDLEWGRSIFKKAIAPSYNAFVKNGELHVILNSGKNLKEKKDGRTKVSTKWFDSSSLYDFVYSKEGKVVHSKIQDNKGKTIYLPHYGTYENDTFIMSSSLRKKKQFMILK